MKFRKHKRSEPELQNLSNKIMDAILGRRKIWITYFDDDYEDIREIIPLTLGWDARGNLIMEGLICKGAVCQAELFEVDGMEDLDLDPVSLISEKMSPRWSANDRFVTIRASICSQGPYGLRQMMGQA